MNDDEAKVESYLKERKFSIERIQRSRNSKTPDFRISRYGAIRFYCEVKSSNDDWLEDKLKAVQNGVIVGGLRPDPTFNRLSSHIHQAVKQFDSINPSLEFPNVLAIVNHDRACSVGDLESVVTGDFVCKDGSRESIYRQYSEGRIRIEKNRVHLFMWFNLKGTVLLRFNLAAERSDHLQELCRLFGTTVQAISRLLR